MEKVIQDSDDDDDTSMEYTLKGLPVAMSLSVGRSKSLMTIQGSATVRDGTDDMFGSLAGSTKRSHTMKTYGSASKSSRGETNLCRSLQQDAAPMQSRDGGLWDMPGTLRNDFMQQREPMFEDQSSTIPDNTMTQKHLVEQALQANRVVTDKDTSQNSETLNSTITWSTSLGSPNKSQPTVRSEHVVSNISQSQQSTGPQRQSRTNAMCIESSQSPGSSILGDDSPKKVQSVGKSPDLPVVTSEDNPSRQRHHVARMLSEIEVGIGSKLESSTDALDELKGSEKREDRIAQKSRNNQSNSDEVWIGLPKEEYKPRPSRSRSSRIAEIHQPQLPEAIRRSRIKRRKTSHNSLDMPATESLDTITKMGFSLSQSKKALKSMGGSIEMAIESLLMPAREGKDTGDELGTGKSGHGGKIEHMARNSAFVEVAIPPAKTLDRVTKLAADKQSSQILMEGRKSKASFSQQESLFPIKHKSTKPTRRHTTIAVTARGQRARTVVASDESDDEEIVDEGTASTSITDLAKPETNAPQATEFQDLPQHPQTEKKRSRGRPRKTDPAQASGERSEVKVDQQPKKSAETISKEDVANQETIAPKSEASFEKSALPRDISVTHIEVDQKEDTMLALPSTPDVRTMPKDNKDVLNHSPLSKGRVPYRVGLSRRHRITPLLRMVKK